jgi:hypothetical protein
MTDRDRHPSDDALRRALKDTLGRGRAPESWVREALAVPARVAPPPAPVRKEPLLVVLLPQLAGLALLLGFVASVLLRPEAFTLVLSNLGRGTPPAALSPDAQRLLQTGLLAGLLVFLVGQGAEGFPILRRFRHPL